MSFSTYASGLNSALGITFDNSNNLYIANGNNIVKVNTLGNQSIFATGFNYTENVVFDNTGFPNGYLYVMDSTNNIYKVDVNGNITTFIIDLNPHYIGMVFDNNNNIYYSSDNNIIYKIDINGNTTAFIDGTGVLSYPIGLTFDNSGNLLIANGDNQYVSKYNSNGNIINGQFISISNNNWLNLIVDKNNNIYACYAHGEYINKYDSNGNLINTIYNDPTQSILGLTFDNIGNLYFTSDNNTTIIKYTIITNTTTNYYIDNSGTFVDLNTIFTQLSGDINASATGFKVNNYGGITGNNLDLNQIFEPYTSGNTAPPTGYVINNGLYANRDLANIFQYIYGVTIVTSGSGGDDNGNDDNDSGYIPINMPISIAEPIDNGAGGGYYGGGGGYYGGGGGYYGGGGGYYEID
jgi:hypothetical protein